MADNFRFPDKECEIERCEKKATHGNDEQLDPIRCKEHSGGLNSLWYRMQNDLNILPHGEREKLNSNTTLLELSNMARIVREKAKRAKERHEREIEKRKWNCVLTFSGGDNLTISSSSEVPFHVRVVEVSPSFGRGLNGIVKKKRRLVRVKDSKKNGGSF